MDNKSYRYISTSKINVCIKIYTKLSTLQFFNITPIIRYIHVHVHVWIIAYMYITSSERKGC